jgi:hypothetical protein
MAKPQQQAFDAAVERDSFGQRMGSNALFAAPTADVPAA